MAAIEPIDISSSDSDIEIEEVRGRDVSLIRGSGSTRVLPPWASRDGPISRTGHDGQFLREAFKSNGSSSTVTKHIPAINQASSSTNGIRLTSQPVYDPRRITDNGCIDRPWAVNSRIATNFPADYEKTSSQQDLKRSLPSSFQPSSHLSKPSKLVENIRPGQLRENFRDSYYPARPSSSSSSAGNVRDGFRRGGDDILMYENNGSRILPPTLLHGKSTSALHVASSSDPFRPSMDEERTSANDERLIYQAALEDLNQPKVEVDLPEGLLSVSLLRHQKIALAWMLQKETRSLHCLGGILADDQGLGKTISTIALIQMQKSLQKNSKPDNSSNHKTEAFNLDDDDENGSVVLDKGKIATNKDGEGIDVEMSEVGSSTRTIRQGRPDAGTLVVCPASVLRQWARELDEKVAEEAKLKVLLYHGGSRTKDPEELADKDVVLTTYSIVTNEVPKQPLIDDDDVDERDAEKHGLSSELYFNKRKKTSNISKKGKKGKIGAESSSIDCDYGPLAKVRWFRVVLDEAQTIKNHRTQVARACCSLRAKRRWCLSGTPIQNTIDDLYSYFRFLKYDPYAAYKSFYHTIKVPISRNSLHGYKKLQAVLRAIMLRRTKETLIDGEPIVKLPPKTINLEKVEFSTEERAFYSHLEAESRSQFKEYAAAGTVNQNYANILLMLLRLRQACDHPLLAQGVNSVLAERGSVSLGRDSLTMAKSLPQEMLYNLSKLLDRPFCLECSDTPEDPVVTMCGHVFCYQCVSEYLTGDVNMCPATGCKEQLGTDIVFSRATLRACISNNYDDINANTSADKSIVLRRDYISSKVKAVLETLQSLSSSDYNGSMAFYGGSPSQSDGPVKAIIFSQWTSMLDLVQNSLVQNGIDCRRLDGTMTLTSRDKAVREFNSDPEILVMLMSLKAGNLGLNMVAACHVILLDLWWNPTTEDQAIDRAHRIGQTRPVTVTRLTIKNTVEDRILSLQEEKKKMVASAFGEDHGGGSATRLTVEDLRYLFMV